MPLGDNQHGPQHELYIQLGPGAFRGVRQGLEQVKCRGEMRDGFLMGSATQRIVSCGAQILHGLEWMGLHVDPALNTETVRGKEGRITSDNSRLHAWVIPTDEELLIARDTARVVLKLEARY